MDTPLITRDEIIRIRKLVNKRILKGEEKKPILPSWKYCVAMATTKAPYNFKKVKRRRKLAKISRRINRRKS